MAEEGHFEPTSPEDILDQLGCFEPAEEVFDPATMMPDAVAPPAALDAQELRSVMDILGQLQESGGEDLAAALQKVRSALTPITEATGATTPVARAVPPPPAAPGEPELECAFDSVADVLEGVFDQAALVADEAGETYVVAREAAAPAPVETSPPASEPAPIPEPEPDPEPDPEPEPVTAEAQDEDLDRILSSLGVGPIEDGEPLAIDEEPDSPQPEVLPEAEAKRPAWMARSIAAWMLIGPVLKTALGWLSLPVRLLPDRLQTAVDWLAVSLVFWVPVVWLMAWLL